MKVQSQNPVRTQSTAPTAPEQKNTPATAPSVETTKTAADAFMATGGNRTPMSLTMESAPVNAAATQQARPAESLWYRFKKHVVLFCTGIDYDPHVHKLDDKAATKLSEVLKPGDVILRRTDGTTSNWVIPGYWGHAALYAGDGKIVDATTHDVREIDLKSFCEEGDAAIVVRPKGMRPEQIEESMSYARAQIGKPYDFDLEFEDESRFTCTELVETALRSSTGHAWADGSMLGISPKDFLNDRFDFVWSSMGTMVR